MATDTERLVLQLSADLRSFQKEMLRASGDADRAAQRVERRFQQMNRQISRDFGNFSNQVRGVLAAIGVGVVVRDVTQLGDVWTRVGNSLAFAGVETANLAATQQLVADIASRTRSDLEATADLFARMLRSSNDLGASMSDVAAVTEIVSKALAGASQTERMGAIRQLGQGLGSGRLQGDELRSILENSRPIAEAIAAEFETTVGNLRKLGQEGRLESRRVFEAILNAGDQINEAFGRTTFTVADAFVRLRTEAARFVGTNEQTSASTRALTRLIDYTANNFQMLADAVVVTATVIGGAFAGVAVARAIGALLAMIATMDTAATRGAALSRALSFFGGPLGIALTAAGAGMAYLATQTDVFASQTERIQRAEDSLYSALQVISGLEVATEGAADQTGRLADEAGQASRALDEMTGDAVDAADALSVQEQAARDLAVAERERAIATIQSAVADREALIAGEQRAIAMRRLASILGQLGDPTEQRLRQQINPGLDEASRAEIESARTRIEFLRGVIERLEAGQLALPRQGPGDRPEGEDPEGANARSRRQTIADLDAQATLRLAQLRHQEALVRELTDAAEIEKRTTAYIEVGLAATEARARAEAQVRAERAASNDEAQRSYDLARLQDEIDLARVGNNVALSDVLSDQLEIRRRTRDLVDQMALSEAEALRLATEWVATMRQAQDIEREYQLDLRSLEDQAEAARLRGDTRAQRAIEQRLELEARIAELRRMGVGEEAAVDRARAEIAALEQADFQGQFRRWFTGGVTAALDGDLDDFFENWLRERAAAGLEAALNDVADILFASFRGVLSSVIQSGSEGLGQAVAAVFSGGATAGLERLGKGAKDASDALGAVLGAAAADAASKLALSGSASAAAAAQENAAAVQKATAAAQVIAAENFLANSARSAAVALQALAGSARANGPANLVSTVVSSLFGGFRASGGPVAAGKAYVVGEMGRELFVPKQPGTIIPAGGFGGGPPINIIDARTIAITGASQAEMMQLRAEMDRDFRTRSATTSSILKQALIRRKL